MIMTHDNLYKHVIYRCIIGSQAYGLAEGGSDTDRRGIYLSPADLQWSFAGAPAQLVDEESADCYWELQKFLNLALQANPSVLECLYSPTVETATPLAEELLAMRSGFLSRRAYQTYQGYCRSQLAKAQRQLSRSGTVKWKHVMHLMRLMLAGITVLKEGFVPVRVEKHAERLAAIRRGEYCWAEVEAWRQSLEKEFHEAFAATRLPEEPDHERAEAFLIKARRSMV